MHGVFTVDLTAQWQACLSSPPLASQWRFSLPYAALHCFRGISFLVFCTFWHYYGRHCILQFILRLLIIRRNAIAFSDLMFNICGCQSWSSGWLDLQSWKRLVRGHFQRELPRGILTHNVGGTIPWVGGPSGIKGGMEEPSASVPLSLLPGCHDMNSAPPPLSIVIKLCTKINPFSFPLSCFLSHKRSG